LTSSCARCWFLLEISPLLMYSLKIDTGRTTVPLSPQILTARTFQTFSNIDELDAGRNSARQVMRARERNTR